MNAQMKEDWFNPEATTFGDRLTGAREAAGMTQKDVARRLGVKLKTIKGWEDDLNEPRANRLSMLAGLLNVSLTWLISGTGEGVEGPGEEAVIDDTMVDVLRQVEELRMQVAMSAEQLERLESAIRGIALIQGTDRPVESAAE
ncbi:MAG: helix-turn-helix transcriptional regulator [Pseudomonadota bacterium]